MASAAVLPRPSSAPSDGRCTRRFPQLASDPLRLDPLDRVHANIAMTLKHYRPWVKSLQDKLEAAVIQAWA